MVRRPIASLFQARGFFDRIPAVSANLGRFQLMAAALLPCQIAASQDSFEDCRKS